MLKKRIRNNLISMVLILMVFHNTIAQIIPEGWFQQTSNLSSTLNSVYFIDSYTGWSAGDNGVILSTTNGGEIWENQKSSVFNNLNNLIFTSPDTGYVIGTTGLILKSINAGLNWIQLSSGTFNDLTSSSFVNNSTGYICGLNNTILKTTNGGTNWNSISFEDSVDYYSIYFINNSTGWLSSVKRFSTVYDTAYILKTIDGGANWFALHSRMNDAVPNLSLQFTDSFNGWCTWQIQTLSGSEILKTTDGGNKWISYGGFFTGDHYYLYFVNNQKGWCAGRNNNIFRTENGSVNWIRSNSFAALFSYESI